MLRGVGQWASYVSVISHLLLHLPDTYTPSCSRSPKLPHLYVHTHTSYMDPREPWHFPQLNRCSFPAIPSQPPRMMSFTRNQDPTLHPKTQDSQDPAPLHRELWSSSWQITGCQKASWTLVHMAPVWTHSTGESLHWGVPRPLRPYPQAAQLLCVSHAGSPIAPGPTQEQLE